MKTLMICFSQTGNTRKIGDYIRDGITEETGQCDMTDLKDSDIASLSDYDLVGIGAPVFYYKEPFNVGDFLESLPELKGQHWFVFCTHGNIIGNFFPSVTEKLRKKGAVVIGFHNSYANITVPFYPRPSYTSGHPDEHDFEQAKAFGRKIVKRSRRITGPDSDLIPAPGPVSSEEWLQDAHDITREYVGRFMPKLSLDTETCNKCHICEEICPVQGISVEADPPRIQEPCIYCWRCVNICPTLSIGADWDMIVSMAPEYYARYRKELDKVSARGEFRWLTDPETIDFSEPLYKQRERKLKNRKNKCS
ncbi:4Fe-4S ferredoxin [Desulfonema ishimotonii]|uniref:4Fe-4S ferredoxin n=1 Tax=Desulfonema ishimotonii TaxID=45657 RepID=A0A401FWS1_9BACT|nr:EFR1 family ferrodoxin [Desulfonema ishimotonii]GBC61401.1 4Fe-4S ferredoxin [Desulfonema ishimotonii]